jgi:hypothetical protein
MRRFASALGLASGMLILLAGCPRETVSTIAAPKPESASIETSDGGRALLRVGSRTALEVPSEDTPLPKMPELAQDRGRIAYSMAHGVRIVHVVGSELVWGETLPSLDWARAKTFQQDAKRLYEQGQRAAILKGMRATTSAASLVEFMIEVADLKDTGEWGDAYLELPATPKLQLLTFLTKSVGAPGPSTLALRHSARWVDMSLGASALLRLETLTKENNRDLAPVVAVMIRSLLAEHPKEVADLACRALEGEGANSPAAGSYALAVWKTEKACPALESVLSKSPCATAVRCAGESPLAPNATTSQNEPLCTAAQLKPFLDREFARKPEDLLAKSEVSAVVPALAALATPPPAFVRAHKRRRYAITTQLEKPACGVELKEGTPCRCTEATLRDAACRSGEALSARSGACALTLDDRKKAILSVVSTQIPK